MDARVKPLDLSNLLKHAFICGRVSAGAAILSEHSDAWAGYDSTQSAAYARILAALEPAPDLAELVEAANGLNVIVEGIQGAMEHGVWRDEKGLRFKDTAQWVTFYNALAKIKEPQT